MPGCVRMVCDSLLTSLLEVVNRQSSCKWIVKVISYPQACCKFFQQVVTSPQMEVAKSMILKKSSLLQLSFADLVKLLKQFLFQVFKINTFPIYLLKFSYNL